MSADGMTEMGFSFDYSDVEKFTDNLKITERDFDRFFREFLTEMAERVIAKTKPRTPVGTPESTGIANYVGGTLRRSWEIGRIIVEGKDIGIEILNPTEYATDVEYGHRIMGGVGHSVEVGWKDGRFMLTISMNEIQAQMPARYESEFKKFCESGGLNVN